MIERIAELARALAVLLAASQAVATLLNHDTSDILESKPTNEHASMKAFLIKARDMQQPLLAMMDQIRTTLNAARQQCYQVAPINRLPDEILIQIFHSPPFTRDDIHKYRQSNAILVSSVCHRWRQLATQTGSLWSTIHFQKPLTHHSITGDRIDRLGLSEADEFLNVARLCLQRSNDCGLEIIFGDIHHMSTELFTAAVDLVLPAFSRWEALEFNGWICDEDQMHQVLSGFLNCCYQNPSQSLRLQSFHFIRACKRTPDSLEKKLLAILDIAPIRSLELGAIKPVLPASVAQSLTYLSLERCYDEMNITPLDLDMVLRQCTRLRSIKINRVDIRDGSLPVTMPTKVILPHLEEIFLVQSGPTFTPMFIYQNVVASSLESFVILVPGTSNSDQEAQRLLYDAMVSFLGSTPSIRSFTYANLPGTHLANALRVLPQLITLTFGLGEYSWDYVGQMTFVPPPLEVCPQLAELQIDTRETNVFSGIFGLVALKHFLEARSTLPGVVPLRALTIKYGLEHLQAGYGEELLVLKEWFSSRVELVWKNVG
ncbi:hypothetical protein BOTBODRAFT_260256 [Botryobasidium botryosum FD-172 SS1]|uniref:F-box domain-containing protein n=1 Tax=Botryobasidium botryosum (strain FD-172 SS1) TaxID=930990 RepID=A0A067MKS1_BOTB1|nr:hypothetical protein BOTBODRAFT_260256 [Botryobasidium botryosum FD-172 SS1]